MLTSTKNHTLSTNILWQFATSKGYSIALWRLPNSSEKHLLIDFSGQLQATTIDLEELPTGFAFSPFQGESLFLKADAYYKFNTDNEVVEDNIFAKNELLFSEIVEQVSNLSYNEEEQFKQFVRKGIEAVQQGIVQKIVPSRTKEITLPEHFDVVTAFDNLCKTYHNAFVSAVYLPDSKTVWMGASPETLVSVNAEGIFKTMALAGTQSAIEADGSMLSPSDARWSHKEIEEQALVCRYIIECFKKIRLREYVEVGPKTVLAGNLLHLRSDYSVDTQAVNFPELGTVMLDLLHPTSAVCGMPKAEAIAFLKENEPHEREFFSGFLGPINVQNASNLFVNIRCMKIKQRQATLFAGVGVTADSNPEKEWKETEIKTQTLLNVIGG